MITLVAARINKGYTQAQVAEKLGVCRATLSAYESGNAFPSVPTIKRIEKLYGVEFKDIDFKERKDKNDRA